MVLITRIFYGFAFTSYFFCTSVVSAGCGKTESKDNPSVQTPLFQTPLYVLDITGNLYQASFDGRPWRLISKHHFESTPNLEISADSRWAVYSGNTTDLTKGQYWIFDTQSGKSRLLFERPPYHGGIPSFSPDGSHIAIFSQFDDRSPDLARDGLYIIESKTMQVTRIGFPKESKISPKEMWMHFNWDASKPVLYIRLPKRGKNGVDEYYSLNVITKTFSPISGVFHKNSSDPIYYINGNPAKITSEQWPQSNYTFGSLPSPNHLMNSLIDKNRILWIENIKTKKKVKVDVGYYEDCEGESLGILGWADNSRLLIYENYPNTYIYDTKTNIKYPFFKQTKIKVSGYFWKPN